MKILEIAEKIYSNELTEFQKDILVRYEYSRNNDIVLNIAYPPRNGRNMIANIINKWESEDDDK